MRKLHIINLEKMGGVERLFLQYINNNAADDDVIFCISNKVGPEIQKHLPGKKITFVNRIINAFTLKYPVFLRKFALQSKLWFANAEAIIIWDLIPGFAARPGRGKVIYYDHGCSWRYAKNKKNLAFFAMLDGCISASCASKRVMQIRFNPQCPMRTVINRIAPPPNIYRGEKALTSPIRLGIAARLVGLKGISVALLAIKSLQDRGIDVTLDIAGKGPDEPHFRHLAEKLGITARVNFLGFQDDLSAFFNRIHIYLSTPVTEPFGLSCMEALFYGVPVIFPLIDGQPEVVKNGICGLGIIPEVTSKAHFDLTGVNINFPYDVYSPLKDSMASPLLMSHEAVADAVMNIVETGYMQYRENAFNYVEKHFPYQNFIQEFESTVMDIINSHD
ncbi:glycosyltransferase [Cronobacter malonaticus]|uniref:glycosyltransferase n=1 Tax=Cronobacter malonaticus TaxID=413503 RepID=UPI0005197686|nr:glycosyltransferase [Cronobacter malonaticus]EGT4373546.1 glycosyltransferase [Cronobacter malonaticus]ELY6229610.1 glycosyltransferase [Cronobacter malonaticus]MDI6469553.1 glycosyltransferase [Cronobacter malonaticus]MDK1178487.1 glycosyltransferase [Cronobacter malonaticus]MDK1687574.1 glycosyltransferase [Cronobacter malonaticus]